MKDQGFQISDAEFLQLEGLAESNVPTEAKHVREYLLGQVEYGENYFVKDFLLPFEPEKRRELLAKVFSRFPAMAQSFLRVQHRELNHISDADVENFLKQIVNSNG